MAIGSLSKSINGYVSTIKTITAIATIRSRHRHYEHDSKIESSIPLFLQSSYTNLPPHPSLK